jgi:hypothetical protein
MNKKTEDADKTLSQAFTDINALIAKAKELVLSSFPFLLFLPSLTHPLFLITSPEGAFIRFLSGFDFDFDLDFRFSVSVSIFDFRFRFRFSIFGFGFDFLFSILVEFRFSI